MSLKLAILLAGVFAGFTSACSLRHVTTYGLLIQSLNDSLPQDYNFPVTVLPVRCQNFSDIAMLKSSLTHLHSMAGKELKPKVLKLLEQIQFENCSDLDKFDGSGFEVQFWNTSYFVAQLLTTLNNFNDCHMNGRTCPAAWPEKRSCLPTDSSTATVTPTDSSSTTVPPTDSSSTTVTPTDSSSTTVTPTDSSSTTVTPTDNSTATVTPTDSSTATVTPTDNSTATVTPTDSSTATVTPTDSSTATVTPTDNSTATVTPTDSSTATVTPTDSPTATVTPTDSSTATVTPTDNSTATVTPTDNSTATVTPAGEGMISPPAGVNDKSMEEGSLIASNMIAIIIIIIISVLSILFVAVVFILWKRCSQHCHPLISDNEETAETESLRAVASV